uniref:Uncharacterized protein n=1 Tax=Arundo donax TaxID=35708 RepID=A0A0A9ASC9_ARUDO
MNHRSLIKHASCKLEISKCSIFHVPIKFKPPRPTRACRPLGRRSNSKSGLLILLLLTAYRKESTTVNIQS